MGSKHRLPIIAMLYLTTFNYVTAWHSSSAKFCMTGGSMSTLQTVPVAHDVVLRISV